MGTATAIRAAAVSTAARAPNPAATTAARPGRPGWPRCRSSRRGRSRTGNPEPIEISDAELAGLRQAATDLQEVFAAGDVASAADRINALLGARARPPRLTTHGGGSGWHLHVDGSDDAPWAEWFLTSSCLALAALLAERQAPPGGFCQSPSCGRPFVNVGRGSTRRYCSAACGTRERVAAYREARDSTSEAAAP